MRKRLSLALAAGALVATMLPGAASAGDGRPLSAELSGENEVPPVATAGSGTASLVLNQGLGQICWEIGYADLSGPPTAAHIHAAPAGQNGGVVVPLAPVDEGCRAVDRALIKSIRKNPTGYYVNVHTAANPGGEIRGQLSK